MTRKVVQLDRRVKLRIRLLRRRTRSACVATKCQIVLLSSKGRASRSIAESVQCDRSWVSRVIAAFEQYGEAALLDGREDNGAEKLSEVYLAQLYDLVQGCPMDHGYPRPTWTQELLVLVMEQQMGVRVSVGTMSRALRRIGARRGRPRPRVACPWRKAAREARLREIERRVRSCAPQDVVVYEDEVDIHLNPKIGLDWMNRGQQKWVMTPGRNEKRYLAGALNARTRRLTCVERPMKNSWLFIALLEALLKDYPAARRIHVVLDNFRIHHSRIVQQALQRWEGRIVLHFLPPYCPDHNKIERVWQDLHANVTRNHQCGSMEELMANVWGHVETCNLLTAETLNRVA